MHTLSLIITAAFIQYSQQTIRSTKMSMIQDTKFTYFNISRQPMARFNVQNRLRCQMTCLSNSFCRTINFYLLTSECELFSDTPGSDGGLIASPGVMMMLVTVPFLPSACSSYVNISDSTRNINFSGATLCDDASSGVLGRWIRFVGPGGTQIPTAPPAIYFCSTHATGWYSGIMPSPGVTVNGTACFNWNGYSCFWSTTITVTNCDTFYTYILNNPTQCYIRYCTV